METTDSVEVQASDDKIELKVVEPQDDVPESSEQTEPDSPMVEVWHLLGIQYSWGSVCNSLICYIFLDCNGHDRASAGCHHRTDRVSPSQHPTDAALR